MIDVSGVSQIFRTGFWLKPQPVLRDVSLHVAERSVFGFLGANGAGKTTLIHLLIGLRAPQSGSVHIGNVAATRPEARARLGYLPERPYFYPHLSATEFLKLYGTLSGLSGARLRSRSKDVLKLVGLAGDGDQRLSRFSKGMLQRIGIAQAILHEPELLILDEPMSGLDPLGRREVRELIRELSAQGRTVFMSSHVIPDVEAICDQVGLIAQGRIVAAGPIGQLLAQGPLTTEIAFAGMTAERARQVLANTAALKAGVEPLPHESFRVRVSSQDEVGTVLGLLLAADAKILWVKPERPSLEELLLDQIYDPKKASDPKKGGKRA